MASPQMSKLTREKLVLGLERASKGLQKRLGESFEVAMIPAVADELLRLQDGQGAELKTFLLSGRISDKNSLLGVALPLSRSFTTLRGDPRRPPHPGRGALASIDLQFDKSFGQQARAGGQSLNRFAKLAEESLRGQVPLAEGIVVAGPGLI